MDAVEYQEWQSVTLEWTVRGLKNLFENSRGEAKSKVTKSVRFGGGRWQILFYPNSGQEGGYVSLYLSCEPTAEEKEQAINGKWVREGLFKFSFELKSTNKSVVFNTKEACDHAFSYKTANWGWAQFAKRDLVYYQPSAVRQSDAFLIVCTITAAPTVPQPMLVSPSRKSVPAGLMDAVGGLLDDPFYSDVEFLLPRRHKAKDSKNRTPRRIWAAKKLLKRVEYFDTMFNSGFAEASTSYDAANGGLVLEVSSSETPNSRQDHSSSRTTYSESTYGESNNYPFEDSDESDSDEDAAYDPISHNRPVSQPADQRRELISDSSTVVGPRVTAGSWDGNADQSDYGSTIRANTSAGVEDEEMELSDVRHFHTPVTETASRGGPSSLSHRSSYTDLGDEALSSSMDVETRRKEDLATAGIDIEQDVVPGPKKTKVIVPDVAYTTYRAFLYYLYTDSIVFAPLSSNFLQTKGRQASPPPIFPTTQGAVQGDMIAQLLAAREREKEKALMSGVVGGAKSRKDWIREWMASNPGRPSPCSAKAIYRLADKLDLRELKARAFQHINKSLTISNIPYEVFSSFSAAFDEVRKIEVDFFLANFSQIKESEALRNVFTQVRVGRHPGFEEVWPAILSNLRYDPGVPAAAKEGPSGRDET